MNDIPSFDFARGGAPIFDLSIGNGFLQIIFLLSLISTIIFTIVLFVHWKKYSPSPLTTFKNIIFYSVGTIAIILMQISLLALY